MRRPPTPHHQHPPEGIHERSRNRCDDRATALCGAAFAQAPTTHSTDPTSRADQARKAAAAAGRKRRRTAGLMAIAIVDTAGQLVYFQKMDQTQTASVAVAQDKAVSAADLPASHQGVPGWTRRRRCGLRFLTLRAASWPMADCRSTWTARSWRHRHFRQLARPGCAGRQGGRGQPRSSASSHGRTALRTSSRPAHAHRRSPARAGALLIRERRRRRGFAPARLRSQCGAMKSERRALRFRDPSSPMRDERTAEIRPAPAWTCGSTPPGAPRWNSKTRRAARGRLRRFPAAPRSRARAR